MKKVLIILGSIILVIVLAAAGGVFYITRGLESGSRVELAGLDLADAEDGVYPGSYNSGRWSNKLQVTVKDGKITDIAITDDVAFVRDGLADKLFDEVIASQDTRVDIVSGATVTSKAYLKSIEDAVNNQEGK